MDDILKIKEYKQIKDQVLAVLNTMEKFVATYPKAELPTPDDNYKMSKELLEKAEFNVVVCGKVKNGKSSMIMQ